MPKKKSKTKKNPKKKRRSKTKKRSSKKRRVKIRKKISKERKIIKKKPSKRKKKIKNNLNEKKSTSNELIFKTKQEWIKNSLANKAQYQNKYNESIKNNNLFWKKEGKRITDKTLQKIKDVKYSKEEVRLNGMKMVH